MATMRSVRFRAALNSLADEDKELDLSAVVSHNHEGGRQMHAAVRSIGMLGIIIAVIAAGGCDKNCIVLDRAAGVGGTITNGTLYADAEKILTDAGAKEFDLTTGKRPRPEVDHSFRLANGCQLWLAVDETTGRVQTMWHWKYRDLSPLVRELAAYRIENTAKKDPPAAQPGTAR